MEKKQDFFSILILVISFTVREVLWGTCLIDSQEANSNLDWYKVFSLSSHKMFSWICSNYPWGSIILGLKDLDIMALTPWFYRWRSGGEEMWTDWTKVPKRDRQRLSWNLADERRPKLTPSLGFLLMSNCNIVQRRKKALMKITS